MIMIQMFELQVSYFLLLRALHHFYCVFMLIS